MSAPGDVATPWQLEVFSVSLKKRQKLRMLLAMLGPLRDERCLLITHGDNPGSLNYHLREAGGRWSWAELEEEGIPEMMALLGEPVHRATVRSLPFPDRSFDRVVVVDAHEHVEDVEPLNREIARVLDAGGAAVVTTPSGDRRLPVAVLKRWVGMDVATYGHVVQGYRAAELEAMLRAVGLEPVARGAYSRFFTELAELLINVAYVKVLGRKGRGAAPPAGEIAPRTAEGLRSVGKSYRAYRLVFPLVRAFSALDHLIPGRSGYAVGVTARKPATAG